MKVIRFPNCLNNVIQRELVEITARDEHSIGLHNSCSHSSSCLTISIAQNEIPATCTNFSQLHFALHQQRRHPQLAGELPQVVCVHHAHLKQFDHVGAQSRNSNRKQCFVLLQYSSQLWQARLLVALLASQSLESRHTNLFVLWHMGVLPLQLN